VGWGVELVVLSSITESNDVHHAVGRLPLAYSDMNAQHDSVARRPVSVDNGHLATSYSLSCQKFRAVTNPQAQEHSSQSLLLTQNNEEIHRYGHISRHVVTTLCTLFLVNLGRRTTQQLSLLDSETVTARLMPSNNPNEQSTITSDLSPYGRTHKIQAI
jgi:hypothetical protein